MKQILVLLIAALLVLSGCGKESSTPETKKAAAADAADAPATKTIAVTGFDPEGEPEIRVLDNGSLVIAFNFMPPSYAENQEKAYADFDKQLEKALGVPVVQDDREFFSINSPKKDTAEKAKAFLEGYRKSHKQAGGPP